MLTLELAWVPLPFNNNLVSIISTSGNKYVKLALFFTRSSYQNCSPALKASLDSREGSCKQTVDHRFAVGWLRQDAGTLASTQKAQRST